MRVSILFPPCYYLLVYSVLFSSMKPYHFSPKHVKVSISIGCL